jgi:hypothetical protein
LERFLEATTPVVASSSCPAKVMRDTTVSPFHLIYFPVETDVVAFLLEMLLAQRFLKQKCYVSLCFNSWIFLS